MTDSLKLFAEFPMLDQSQMDIFLWVLLMNGLRLNSRT